MVRKPEDNSPQGNAARASIAKQQAAHRRRNRGNSTPADWRDADVTKLHNAVVAVTGCGCAIQFGYTADGGSFVTRIVGDGEPYNEYVRPTEDIDAHLDAITMDFAK